MASQPPIVPSKNALRALRRLAFSNSMILAGAAGSACGIASLNYEARRRVRFAEQIVQNKKIIRSVSNGKGANHMARMFEAAERGEDFTLDRTKSHKRRRVRNYSTVAPERSRDENYNVSPLQHSRPLQIVQNTRSRPQAVPQKQDMRGSPFADIRHDGGLRQAGFARDSNRDKLITAGNPPDAAKSLQQTQQIDSIGKSQSFKPFKDPVSAQKNMRRSTVQKSTSFATPSLAQRIAAATTQPHESGTRKVDDRNPSTPLNDARREEVSSLPKKKARNDDAVQRIVEATLKQHKSGIHTVHARQPRPNSDGKSGLVEAVDMWLKPQNHSTPAISQMTIVSPIDLRAVSDPSDESSELRTSLQRPHPSIEPKLSFDQSQAAFEHKLDATNAAADHDMPSQSHLRNETGTVSVAGQTSISNIVLGESSFRDWFAPASKVEAEQKSSSSCSASDNSEPDQVAKLDQGVSDLTQNAKGTGQTASNQQASLQHNEMHTLSIRSYQAGDASIAMQDILANIRTSRKEQRNDLDDSLIEQVQEARRLISLVSESKPKQLNNVVKPILCHLCSIGELELAQQIVRDVESNSDIYMAFVANQTLVHAFAINGDWTRVQRIMEKIHTQGISRKRPFGFAELFNRIFEVYLSQKTISQAYDYLIHAIGYWGLVPTNTISATIISACLKTRQYSLIQEWVQAVRQLFPRVDTGIASLSSAWSIGKTWKEMEASCEEIEKGCQAMAFGSLRDPFSPTFRGIALEAVTLDIRTRLTTAHALLDRQRSLDEAHLFTSMNLDRLLEHARQLLSTSPKHESLTREQQLHLKGILQQISAVTKLNELFGGADPEDKFKGVYSQGLKTPASTPSLKELNALNTSESLPKILEHKDLPSAEPLLRIVTEYYHLRRQQGLPPSHHILRFLTPKLESLQRETEALDLLEVIYESPYVQGQHGTPFDLDLFSLWLRLAHDSKAIGPIRRILWAVLDSSRHIEPSTHFILLCKMAMNKAHGKVRLQGHSLSAEETREFAYLKYRLNRLSWVKKGMVEPKRFMAYKTWEERMKEDNKSILV